MELRKTAGNSQIEGHRVSCISIVEQVAQSGLCSGCGLCESISGAGRVEMKLTQQGFMRPVVINPIDVTTEKIVRRSCPGVLVEHDMPLHDYHPIWGALKTVQTGFATDKEIRRLGSSGGVISALANYLLDSNQVDFVAQMAVSVTDPLANDLQLSFRREDVLRAAGSRYAPSAPLRRVVELLDSGKRFAFVGKPCDVAALRQFGRLDDRVSRQIPFMLSFMCAGIPSQNGTRELLRKMGVEPSEVKSFRYRGDGWPGKARAVTHSGESHEMDYNSSWGSVLNRHLQFRCKICPDGTGEFADVVCADAWYGKDGYPEFDEKDGRSLVLGRTDRGVELIRKATDAGSVIVADLAVEEIAAMQPYQVDRKRVVLGRVLATRLALGRAPSYRNMGLLKASIQSNFVVLIRNVLGTFRRAKGEAQ